MIPSDVHQCECPRCQQETAHPEQALHRRINLLVSRLDEQQRRWYVAMEAERVRPGGDELLSQITGLDPKTIQRGRQELETGVLATWYICSKIRRKQLYKNQYITCLVSK